MCSSEVSVAFNISSSHSNTNSPINPFLHEQFLILNIRHFLQSHVVGFHIESFSQEPWSFNLLHSHRHLSRFHFYFKINKLLFNPHLHSQDSCWTINLVLFIPDIKLNTFTFIFFTLFGTKKTCIIVQLHDTYSH